MEKKDNNWITCPGCQYKCWRAHAWTHCGHCGAAYSGKPGAGGQSKGTGKSSKAGIYDEEGYLALPPCLWGEEPGLHPSILLPPNTPLVSIKKNRNTHQGHFGEMASWQMRGISF